MNDTLTIESWEAQWETVSDRFGSPESALAAREALLQAFELLATLGRAGVVPPQTTAVALVPSSGYLVWDVEACVGHVAPALDLSHGEVLFVDLMRRPLGRLSLRLALPAQTMRFCASHGQDAAAEASVSLNERIASAWAHQGDAEFDNAMAEYARWYNNAARFIDTWLGRAERVYACGLDPQSGTYALTCSVAATRVSGSPDLALDIKIGLSLPERPSEGPVWFVEPVEDWRPDWLAPFPGVRWVDATRIRAELPATTLGQNPGMRSQAASLRAFVEHAVRVIAAAAQVAAS